MIRAKPGDYLINLYNDRHGTQGDQANAFSARGDVDLRTVVRRLAQTTMEQVSDPIKKVQKATSSVAQDLQFFVDKDNVKLPDSKTQTVLKQIPTEQEALDIPKHWISCKAC